MSADTLNCLKQAVLQPETVEELKKLNVHGLVDTSTSFLDLTPMTEHRFDRAGPFYGSYAVAGLRDKFGLLRPDATWAVEPMTKMIAKFERSTRKYPVIAPGTPDPYTPTK